MGHLVSIEPECRTYKPAISAALLAEGMLTTRDGRDLPEFSFYWPGSEAPNFVLWRVRMQADNYGLKRIEVADDAGRVVNEWSPEPDQGHWTSSNVVIKRLPWTAT